MKKEIRDQILNAFRIESDSILATRDCMDMEAFSRAVDVLSQAPRIAATGCGHSATSTIPCAASTGLPASCLPPRRSMGLPAF